MTRMARRSLFRALLLVVAVAWADRASVGGSPGLPHSSMPSELLPGDVGRNASQLEEEAGRLIPAEDQARAEDLWHNLKAPEPGDRRVAWNRRLPRGRLGEELPTRFKDTVKKSDLMDEAGVNIRNYAEDTTNAVLDVHQNMKDWKDVVNDTFQEVDGFDRQADELHKHTYEDLKDMNAERLREFDELVEGDTTLDNALRQRQISSQPVFQPEHRTLAELRGIASDLGETGSGLESPKKWFDGQAHELPDRTTGDLNGATSGLSLDSGLGSPGSVDDFGGGT